VLQRKAEYICADHPVTFIFRLRQSGGPYIPDCRDPGTIPKKVSGPRTCQSAPSMPQVAFWLGHISYRVLWIVQPHRCGRWLVMKSDTRPAAGGSIFARIAIT
jgi:hypothetical protein